MRNRFLLKALPGLVFALLPLCNATAQALSYLYIQGDKKVPIYVKLDGEMQPRLGKNYVIVSQLAPGPTKISVVFQQNIYPEQFFTVLIPESGSRNFLVAQKDGRFNLYDLQQHFYLPANNQESDDHLPEAYRSNSAPGGQQDSLLTNIVESPADTVAAAPLKHDAMKPAEKKEPDFLQGVVLNADTATINNVDGEFVKSPMPSGIINSDCPAPMSSSDFSTLYKSTLDANGDEDRLAVLLKETEKCYSTVQVRSITSLLSLDAARLSYLRKIYSRVSDQAQFPLLDDLLREAAWKAEFESLIAPGRSR